MEELISVIVPVYNVESYLAECLDSLERQTHHHCEFILVDDGSTDRSREIAARYAERDKRFILHFTEKCGASAARNRGMDQAKGEYIAFVDSDDWVEQDYLETQLSSLKHTSADFSVCDFYTGEKATGQWTDAVFEGDEILTAYFHNGIYNRVYNKLFRRELLNDIRFPEGRDLVEDGVFTAKVLAKAKRLCRISKPLYHYRVRENSLIRKKRSHDEKCGLYWNAFEKISIMASIASKADQIDFLLKDFRKTVYSLLDSGVDLKKSGLNNAVSDCARLLLQKANSEQNQDKTVLLLCDSIPKEMTLRFHIYKQRRKRETKIKKKLYIHATELRSLLRRIHYGLRS